ncbi:MAG TPA: SMP-30/gluconolactonase/LRE family protein [Steroidobacteraceae bacterium]|nr:SMP-30/gluconolactonase/LRE family protein [Steroidobacteraceae bacterium]
MKRTSIAFDLAVLGWFSATSAMAQIPTNRAQPAGSGVQAGSDAREPLIRSLCKHPLPPPASRSGFRPRPNGPFPYEIKAIPGVVAAGEHWKLIWVHNGNNADGIIAQPDGSILAAQNDESDVVRIAPDGQTTVVYRDTNTGGSLSMNKQGELFIVERALIPSVWELAPERKLIADSYQGEPLECAGRGALDSPAALHTGGIYFGWAGLYYADPHGTVTKFFDQDVNDAVLSPDEQHLYFGSLGKLYAADVGSDGRLSDLHVLAEIPGGGNDGAAVDAQGRIYIVGYPGVRVFRPDGKYLGTIPAPRNLIDVVFSGPDKKTLFAVAYVLERGLHGFDEIYTLPMTAQGYLGRAK